MRSRIPIIYLVDSAGVNLPYQGGVFPGQYGAARLFYYNSIMRRYLKVPQIAAVMGQCVAGGAYLPALSDEERDDFAGVYLDVLRRLDALFGVPLPYIAAWHQAPVHIDRDLAYLHLQVFSIRRAVDKLKSLAGSESGMGAFVTDVRPEDVAHRLREVGS